jgi:hypothetical protein
MKIKHNETEEARNSQKDAARANGAKGGRPTVTAYMSQVWDGEEWRNTSKIAMTRAVAINEARVMRKFGDKSRVIKLDLGE